METAAERSASPRYRVEHQRRLLPPRVMVSTETLARALVELAVV